MHFRLPMEKLRAFFRVKVWPRQAGHQRNTQPDGAQRNQKRLITKLSLISISSGGIIITIIINGAG